MRHTIHFVKASGAGNDFVVLNNMERRLRMEKAPLARALCDRHLGVGGDGLLLLEHSESAEFRMLYFNADGSSGGMCGNGGRCAALVAWLSGIAGRACSFEALDYVYRATIQDGGIRLSMKDPRNFRRDLDITADNRRSSCHSLDTGSPHVVLFMPDIEHLDVVSVGRALRNAPAFQPEGTNVNFVKLISKAAIDLRTYERGVEGETLACGTGSIASAVAGALVHDLEFPVDVHVRSGATLRVDARRDGTSVTDVVLEGPAEVLFQGEIEYDSSREIMVARTVRKLSWEPSQ
jgi:diaminopimelate epimerase